MKFGLLLVRWMLASLLAHTVYLLLFLKTIGDYMSEPLAFLVNDSFVSGNFPEKLKLARITPVFKKGSRFDIDNYRPVSVLFNSTVIWKN